jgi:DNA-binding protein Fis
MSEALQKLLRERAWRMVREGQSYADWRRETERPLLEIALADARGSQVRAAKQLGINRNTLRKRIKEYGLQS